MIAASFAYAWFLRAILDAIAEGEAYAITIHDRLRWSRGFDVEHLGELGEVLREFEALGLVSSRVALPDARMRLDRPRRIYALTPRGMDERARLAFP